MRWYSWAWVAVGMTAAGAAVASWHTSGSGMSCHGKTAQDRATADYNDWGFYNESTTASVTFFCDQSVDISAYAGVGVVTAHVYDRDSTASVAVDWCATLHDGTSRQCYAMASGGAFTGFKTMSFNMFAPEDPRQYWRGVLPKKTANGNSILTWHNISYYGN